jgi:hypothetical protein
VPDPGESTADVAREEWFVFDDEDAHVREAGMRELKMAGRCG